MMSFVGKNLLFPTKNVLKKRAKVIPLDDYVLCRILIRRLMYVLPGEYAFSGHVTMDGYWEWPFTEAISGIVKPDMNVIDARANVGYFTMLQGDFAGRSGKITAIEANPACTWLLCLSVGINGFDMVNVQECALGSENGVARFVYPSSGTVYGKLEAIGNGPWVERSVSSDVRVRSIDNIIGNERIDFIKMDIEGAESAAWQGMKALVARDQPLTIALEFSKGEHVDPAGFTGQNSWRIPLWTGYRLWSYADYPGRHYK